MPVGLDDAIVQGLKNTLNNYCASVAPRYLDLFQDRISRDLRAEASSALQGIGASGSESEVRLILEALLSGEVNAFADGLASWVVDVPEKLDPALRDTLAGIQATVLDNTSYDYIIHTTFIAAASELFSKGLHLIEELYPEISVTTLATFDRTWADRQLRLQQTGYELLKREVDKRAPSDNHLSISAALVTLLTEFALAEARRSAAAFRATAIRAFVRQLKAINPEGGDPSVDVAFQRITHDDLSRLRAALWPTQEPTTVAKHRLIDATAVHWGYIGALLDQAREAAAIETLQRARKDFASYVLPPDLWESVAGLIDRATRQVFKVLEDECLALGRTQVRTILEAPPQ